MSQFDFGPSKASSTSVYGVALAVSVAVNLLLGLALIAVLFSGGSENPEPLPVNAVTIMEQAEKTRLLMEADAAEELGRKIAEGEVKNSNQLYQWAKAYQDKIDEVAYEEINNLNQQVLAESESGWGASQIERIQEFQRQKAEGKRRIAK